MALARIKPSLLVCMVALFSAIPILAQVLSNPTTGFATEDGFVSLYFGFTYHAPKGLVPNGTELEAHLRQRNALGTTMSMVLFSAFEPPSAGNDRQGVSILAQNAAPLLNVHSGQDYLNAVTPKLISQGWKVIRNPEEYKRGPYDFYRADFARGSTMEAMFCALAGGHVLAFTAVAHSPTELFRLFQSIDDVSFTGASPPTTTSGMEINRRGLEVLSDTMGVDLGPYIFDLQKKIRLYWYGLIPAEARAPERKQGKVSVEFSVTKAGYLIDVKQIDSTGSVALDRAAKASITESSPFRPLPPEFKGDTLHLRFHFAYNQ